MSTRLLFPFLVAAALMTLPSLASAQGRGAPTPDDACVPGATVEVREVRGSREVWSLRTVSHRVGQSRCAVRLDRGNQVVSRSDVRPAAPHCAVGETASLLVRNRWVPVTITRQRGLQCEVRGATGRGNRVETTRVAPERLAWPADRCVEGPARLSWNGDVVPVRVLGGPDASGNCPVRYEGRPRSWDQAVDPARLAFVTRPAPPHVRPHPPVVVGPPTRPVAPAPPVRPAPPVAPVRPAPPVRPGPIHVVAPAPPQQCVGLPGLQAQWGAGWYDATILAGPDNEGRCYISYDGWSDMWNEWVDPSRLRGLAG